MLLTRCLHHYGALIPPKRFFGRISWTGPLERSRTAGLMRRGGAGASLRVWFESPYGAPHHSCLRCQLTALHGVQAGQLASMQVNALAQTDSYNSSLLPILLSKRRKSSRQIINLGAIRRKGALQSAPSPWRRSPGRGRDVHKYRTLPGSRNAPSPSGSSSDSSLAR